MTDHFQQLNILAITVPIFTIIGMGYFAVRFHQFPKEGVLALGQFVLGYALPAIIFKSISEKHLDEMLDFRYLLVYGFGSILSFGVVFIVSKKRGQGLELSAISALGSSSSNSAFIGLPIVVSYLGSKAMIGVALSMIIENAFMLPLMFALAECASTTKVMFRSVILRSAKQLLRNRLIVAVVLGFVAAKIQLNIPEPFANVINMFAYASTAVALFAIGGMLVGLELHGKFRDISYIVFGKLILHPFMVAFLIFLLPTFDGALQTTAILLAAMPMMSIYPILGQRYQLEGVCSAALLLATSLSFLSISTLIWLINVFQYRAGF